MSARPVLSLCLCAGACAGAPAVEDARIEPPSTSSLEPVGRGRVAPAPALDLHLGDAWFAARAEARCLSPEEARARDATFADAPPDPSFWDEQIMGEVAAVWTSLCRECHGGDRGLHDVRSMSAPTDGWGLGKGRFFGRRRSYARVLRVLREGVPGRPDQPPRMPAWEGRLSYELMWGLAYFVDVQSQ